MSDQEKDLQKPDAATGEEPSTTSPPYRSSPAIPRSDIENTTKDDVASPTEPARPAQELHEQPEQQPQQLQQQTRLDNLPPPVRTLKEAFPDVDIEVIEAILESQRGLVEPSFEVLLGMSDPSYQPEMPPRPQSQAPPARQAQYSGNDDVPAPPMPPRPTTGNNNQQYGNWQQPHREPRTVEEQMRMDEEYARQIALEEERLRVQQYRRQRQNQQENDQPLFNFQEELPIIKERMIEAGNAAKKKVMDLYNQFKAARANNAASGSNSSMPTTNAQYRGLPRDEADDLLAGDVSALRLSDNDVYAQTTRPAQRQSGDYRANEPGVIHVNSPLHEQGQGRPTSVEEQIRADEELARRLAREDQAYESHRERTISNNENISAQTPRSRYTSSDGEPVTLTAATTQTNPSNKPPSSLPTEPIERRSYVIRDEDDSDDDDLVDVDETEQKTEKDVKEKAT